MEAGWHKVIVKTMEFTVERAYQPLDLLGKGAFGEVCSARHGADLVAIKRIRGVLDAQSARLLEAKRTVREIQLLRHLNHDNVISIKHVMLPGNDVYIVTDLMDSDLNHVIRSEQPLSDDHCQWFLYQMLCAVKYIHSANIVHRDLKPANVLLNANCDLKISDFGLARSVEDEMTQYVVTRWSRAPEILLLARTYSKAVDLWSVGCIFAELLRRKPLFQGRDPVDQLRLITSVLGTPPLADLDGVDGKLVAALSSLPPKQPVPLRHACPRAASGALELLGGLLQFSAVKRFSAEEALRHDYLSALHEPEAECEAATATPFTEQDIEDQELDWPTLRTLLHRERRKYSPAATGGAEQGRDGAGDAAAVEAAGGDVAGEGPCSKRQRHA